VRYLKATLALALLGALWAAAPAAAEVKWWTKTEWGPSTLKPGGKGQLLVYTRNYGLSPSEEYPVAKIVDQLPAGVIATAVRVNLGDNYETKSKVGASCSGVGSSTVNCTMTGYMGGVDGGESGVIPLSKVAEGPTVLIDVRVSPGAGGTGTNTVTMSGGGDPTPAVEVHPMPFGDVPEAFGINPSNFAADAFDAPFPGDGAPYRQAGGHPGDLRLAFDFNAGYRALERDPSETFLDPVGRVRTVRVTLPPGLIGNPEALPKCQPLDFLRTGQTASEATGCPPDTQVGSLDVTLGNGTEPSAVEAVGGLGYGYNRIAVYNLVPPRGTPIDLGFRVGQFASGHVYATLDASRNYAIRAESPYISQTFPIRSVRTMQWGVPADPVHDLFRAQEPVLGADGDPDERFPAFGAPFTAPVKPFFTNPSDCGVDNGGFLISADSWNDPGNFTAPIETEEHLNVSGCDDERIRFQPDIALQPTSRAAGGPTGLRVHLEVPQRDQTVDDYEELYAEHGSLHGIDTPPIKKAVVRMPEGMTLSTSAAQGLTGCSAAQIGLGTNDPVGCPDSSQYGELTLHTPLLPEDEPMRGYLYIAKQGDNPFGTFLALYLVIEDQDRGLRVKIPGRVDLDPVTGQITTSFDELPQFPLSDMELSLKGGIRAGLVNPATCGAKQITATFYSWATPETPITKTSSYEVTQPCVNDLAERPFAPEMSAGTLSNAAGSFSSFVFRLTRTDDDQEFSQLQATLPPGLSAKIAGIAKCPEAGIAQAISRTAAGDGALEVSNPSCPASSLIGSTDVGTGVGQALTYIPGKAYLAGPYRGAPLSLVVITPILAGPYDLGVVAVRTAIDLDSESAQASVKSDPFPQIYQGIPVRIRDIRVKIDRPETMLNPTSCDPMQITSRVTGVGGDLYSTADDSAADLSARFQAANCASLGFKPRLSFRLEGGTKRGDHPAFRAVLKGRPGDANIADTAVTLPRSAFLDQGHIRTVCTRAQFATESCPPGSVYGHAKAITPLLDEPLEGPVYLRSSSHLLPDLVVALRGEIEVDLVGRIDSRKGRIRSSFETVPDAPVTKFVLSMQGAKKGLIQNSRDLCAHSYAAMVQMSGQNGKAHDFQGKVAVSCGKANQRNKKQGGVSR
jgi:hypothetical protein